MNTQFDKKASHAVSATLIAMYNDLKSMISFMIDGNVIIIESGNNIPNKIAVMNDETDISILNRMYLPNIDMYEFKKIYRKTKHTLCTNGSNFAWTLDAAPDDIIGEFNTFESCNHLRTVEYGDNIKQIYTLPLLDYKPMNQDQYEHFLEKQTVTVTSNAYGIDTPLLFNCGVFPEINTKKLNIDNIHEKLQYCEMNHDELFDENLDMRYVQSTYAFKYVSDTLTIFTITKCNNI